ncbi:MAG: hypothetical protein DWI00_06180 [Planctomycetota bacterium]|nr:MAG: hypothetical protein DWI00_06180 [Planctomycetota bacterium]
MSQKRGKHLRPVPFGSRPILLQQSARRGPACVTHLPQASGYGVYAGERQNLNPIFRFSRPKFETNGAMSWASR